MDEELLAEFLTESNENLTTIEERLLALESDPGNREYLDAIFRVIHTVKGSCGFLGLKRLEKVAHAGENLLSRVRSTGFRVDGDIVSLLLENSDAIKSFIIGLEETGQEPNLDYTGLCVRLSAAEQLIEASSASGRTAAPAPVAAPPPADPQTSEAMAALQWLTDIDDNSKGSLLQAGFVSKEQVLEAGFEKLKSIQGMAPAVALKILGLAKSSLAASQAPVEEATIVEVPATVKRAAPAQEPVPDSNQVIAVEAVAESAAGENETVVVQAQDARAVQPIRKSKTESSIRVDVALLDELMNQVGELVLSRNRLLRLVEQGGGADLVRTSRGISQITSRLQEKLLHTRMQPISTLWGSVPRLLRDITRQLGKKIRVEMEGQETELDRTILAALKDPMTHIIRNSCDHGIEMPEIRRKSGKPDEGVISLKASQENGFIVVEISDDGGGINPKKIREKALKMGVITADKASSMSDKSSLQLIFHAGLSTAEQVSNLSGRGVGMDVVRSEIEGVGGTVEIDSELGSGTTLHIRIPLTLAIIPAMIVSSRNQHFAIPQMVVQELMSIDQHCEDREMIAGRPFYRLRGRLLPIVPLSEVLRQDSEDKPVSNVVVVNIGERRFGIGVDQILGAEEIVVKPLGKHFHHLDAYGGCSILGDGMVVPILDCMGITRDLRKEQGVEAVVSENNRIAATSEEESQYILVFAVGDQWYAIPMALVERIEEIASKDIERSGRREVLQYRGDVLQVIRLATLLEVEPTPSNGVEACLIISDQGRRLCIQVDNIIDIVKQKLDIHLESSEPYFIGTAVVEGRSTEVVDIFEVIRKSAPNWFAGAGDRRRRTQRILYVEDAVFYRNLVLPVLEGLGCEALTVRNGAQAQELLSHQRVDLILTDLEMPEVNGFELAQWVRQRPELSNMPIISLSSLDISEFADRADLFNACVKKFDRDVLIQQLTKMLGRKQPQQQTALPVDANVIDVNGSREGEL